jgi:adenylate cyclase
LRTPACRSTSCSPPARRAGSASPTTRLHPPPGRLADRSYADFAASLGQAGARLGQLFAAFGIAEPEPDSRLSSDDEALLAEMLEIALDTGQPDLALRAIRMFGEGARRAADGALGVYGEAVRRTGVDLEGLPAATVFDQLLRPWARFARRSPMLAEWLASRHLSRAIDEYSVTQTERILQDAGFIEGPLGAPPAVAFVDLTVHAHHRGARRRCCRGDRDAPRRRRDRGRPPPRRPAREAAGRRRPRPVRRHARRGGGHRPAGRAPGAGLPTSHAGIASGPLIARDGDVFGRSVNLAARIADAAPDGRLWMPQEVARELPPGRVVVAATEGASLQGIGQVALVDVSRRVP